MRVPRMRTDELESEDLYWMPRDQRPIQVRVFAEQLAGCFVVRLRRGDLVVELAQTPLLAVRFDLRAPFLSLRDPVHALEPAAAPPPLRQPQLPLTQHRTRYRLGDQVLAPTVQRITVEMDHLQRRIG